MLLPAWCLLRRADSAAVIGAALGAAAAGDGHRKIAGVLGRAASTVRGWLRRFAGRAEEVRVFFTVLLARTGPDPVMPAGAAGPVAAAVRMPSPLRRRLCKPGRSGYSWPEEAARSRCAGWAEPPSAGGQLILHVKRWHGRSRCRRRVRVCSWSCSRPSGVCR